MLSPNLVRTTRRGDELRVVALAGAARERALELAELLIAAASEALGSTRAEVKAALAEVPIHARDAKLGAGLLKLIDDASTFNVGGGLEPVALRRDVFLQASRARAAGERVERGLLTAAAAAERGVDAGTIERSLFADLKSEHVFEALEPLAAEGLVRRYELAQLQAVLLKAVRLEVEVSCRDAGTYRALFRRLKFRRLLHSIRRAPEGDGYQLTIDGPYSLFDSVTKYGLELALVLPAIQACDRYRLSAELRWGRRAEPLTLRLEGGADARADELDAARLPDEVRALVEAFAERKGPWRARPGATILDLPGVGLCVPDLVFQHEPSRQKVYFEVLGYWSRDAVWRRVELVEAGLKERILFAVSRKLRVSEEVLDESACGGLYVYGKSMSAREVERRLEALRLATG